MNAAPEAMSATPAGMNGTPEAMSATAELNLSATPFEESRQERLVRYLARDAKKWTPTIEELAEVCLAVDEDEDWTNVVVQAQASIKVFDLG